MANNRIRGLGRIALSLWLAFSLATPARGADLDTLVCWADFVALGRAVSTGNWDKPAHPTGRYLLEQSILARQKAKLTPEQYQAFLDWYYDHFFSERWVALSDNMGSKQTQLHRSTRYDSNGERPFAGYLKAREDLAQKPLAKTTLDDLNEAHRDLLSWRSVPGSQGIIGWLFSANSERTPSKALGKPRTGGVGFHIDPTERNVEKLLSPTSGESPASSPTDLTQIHDVNPLLRYTPPEGDDTTGWVSFTPISEWRKSEHILSAELKTRLLEAEEEAKSIPPPDLATKEAELLKTIQGDARERFMVAWDRITTKWQRGRIDTAERDRLIEKEGQKAEAAVKERFEEERKSLLIKTKALDWAASKQLHQDFITEVFQHHWDKVKADLKGAHTQQQVINLVADFYYDFVSIHPYRNGNGRMGRLLAERLLEAYNLPPPVWTHLGEDILLSRQDFAKLFRDAVDVSRQLHQDIDRLITAGVPVTGANIDFTAGQVSPEVVQKYPIDTDEFLTWVAAGHHEYPSMRAALTAFHTWRESMDYEKGNGRGVRLANSLFIGSFGRTSSNQGAYDAKMERFYSAKGKVSRAVEVSAVPSDLALLKHFSLLTTGTSPGQPVEPSKGFASFNATLVRAPGQVRRWPDGWFGSASSAENAGIVSTYWSGSPIPEKLPKGEAKAVVSLTARRRETATVDRGKATGELGQARDSDQRLVLHAVGIDPEAVTEVEVKETGSSHRRVAERTSFNRVEIREYYGTRLVSTQKYLLLKDGTWKPQ